MYRHLSTKGLTRAKKKYFSVTLIWLQQLFNRSEATIFRWIRNGKLDPYNIWNIMDLYQQLNSQKTGKGTDEDATQAILDS